MTAPTPQTAAPWKPAIPLSQVAKRCRDGALKLQRALRRVLVLQHNPNVTRLERERTGLEDYEKEFGVRISDRYLRELVKRTIDRDGGAQNWDRLEIYLPERLVTQKTSGNIITQAVSDVFGDIGDFLTTCANPQNLSGYEQQAVWSLVFKSYRKMIATGIPAKRAARHARAFLLETAPALAPTRDALLKAFNRKLEKIEAGGGELIALRDGRTTNGSHVEIPQEDIDRLRASAALKNSGRIEAAWREEHKLLSLQTRTRYPDPQQCPRKIHELLNREIVDAITARHHGKLTLRRMVGTVESDYTGISSMHEFIVDDVTSNIEAVLEHKNGTQELLLAQTVAVMSRASRKFVGWATSVNKGPTAELSCAAVLDAIKTHGVPQLIRFENGFVFGKSLNINGKEDEQGRTLVAGLAQYGCAVRHFDRMNPTGKAALEKGFDLLQQRMERHPGYAGRLQILNAPEDFKREGRLIRSGKIDAKEYRYTFPEFVEVLGNIIREYNAKPQHGQLNGLSPNEAHALLQDKNNPPIKFTPELEWLLANERYRVPVEVGGVRFTHYGRSIRVRGGRLPEFIGTELWALISRTDDSLVTFMKPDFTDPFTIGTCEKPSACESLIAPGSGVLGRERAKIREHQRAVEDEYQDLLGRYGNPRKELLAAIRNKPVQPDPAPERQIRISKRLTNSAAAMNQQRAEFTHAKEEKSARVRNLRAKAARNNVPTVLVNDGDEQQAAALDLLAEANKLHAREQEENQP